MLAYSCSAGFLILIHFLIFFLFFLVTLRFFFLSLSFNPVSFHDVQISDFSLWSAIKILLDFRGLLSYCKIRNPNCDFLLSYLHSWWLTNLDLSYFQTILMAFDANLARSFRSEVMIVKYGFSKIFSLSWWVMTYSMRSVSM